jgi:hypothetical protein
MYVPVMDDRNKYSVERPESDAGIYIFAAVGAVVIFMLLMAIFPKPSDLPDQIGPSAPVRSSQ